MQKFEQNIRLLKAGSLKDNNKYACEFKLQVVNFYLIGERSEPILGNGLKETCYQLYNDAMFSGLQDEDMLLHQLV